MSTTFFTILLQQNLCEKLQSSSNLNPPLKLFFYSPILTNNNLLLKIYCDSISHLGFFIFYIIFPFFHFMFIHTFFFSCFLPPHKGPISYIYPPFFYFLFLPRLEHSYQHSQIL